MGAKLFTPSILQEPSRVPTGFAEIDAVTGGLPRGELTEIYGPVSSGRTSVGISVLAQRTAQGEICAWVDAGDGFDPRTAQNIGVTLHRLLWVRCRDLEQAIQTTDLILASAGFGLVVLDLGSVPLRSLHRLPLSFWFRFRRAVEHTPTLLLVLAPEACAKSCTRLCLRLRLEEGSWLVIPETKPVSHSHLLGGLHLNAEVTRSRFERPSRMRLRTKIIYRARRGGFTPPFYSHVLKA
ncbi:MAG: hypothetical protein ACRD2B_10785 [Terriglobia bacterium]